MDAEFLHDLRQPLTAIQNFSRACINELRRHPSGGEKVIGWLESVNEQARKASDMLKELKAQGPSVNRPLVPTDIRRCIEHALHGLRGEGVTYNGVLNAERDAEPYLVLGDPLLLEPVFRDLLVGAVDSSRPREDAPARVFAVRIGRESTELVLEIRADAPDCGSAGERYDIGMAGGACCALAVGLSACEAIIECHGGSLALWRRQDETVRIQARLPAYRPETGSA